MSRLLPHARQRLSGDEQAAGAVGLVAGPGQAETHALNALRHEAQGLSDRPQELQGLMDGIDLGPVAVAALVGDS